MNSYVTTDWCMERGGDSGEKRENNDSGNTAKRGSDDSSNDAAEYNIAENIGIRNSEGQARLQSRYFELYLPADGNWDYEVYGNTSVGIFYSPARQAGYGGNLVTLEAYDWGDSSYGDLPSYQVAGLSENKIYVAVFPTDVQYGPDQEEGYRRMLSYVKKMNNSEEASSQNPLIICE